MRLSCHGCRVLRKGCGEGCTIRPCLQWIKNPESQANATVFLAKFYGRAGLVNLINAGPEHLRPAIFKSLLYEACGRIVNPIYGSAGLLWSGSWQLCQAAVDAVLRGMPIIQLPTESAISSASPPLKACDIRHVVKGEKPAPCDQLHKVNKPRTRFKNTTGKPKSKVESASLEFVTEIRNEDSARQSVGSFIHELGTIHNPSRGVDTDCVSAETVEVSLAKPDERADSSDVDLELTLAVGQLEEEVNGSDDDTWTMTVGSRAGLSLYI